MKHDTAYYLAKGFDQRMAAYFAAGRRTIVHVVPNDDYTLTLTFDNGEKRLYDVSPMILPGTVFSAIASPASFKQAYLDDSHCVCWDIDPTVDSQTVWSNKLDLCPDSCYVDSTPLS